VVGDQRLSPTSAEEAAARLLRLLEVGAPAGAYHLANQGSCSWFELAEAVLALAGVEASLERRSTGPEEVRRPPSSILADTRTGRLGLPPARPWREAVAGYLRSRS
jgi:dTDP-4-dehydrorhamnose reductase